jgi:Uma2 family endonuclease
VVAKRDQQMSVEDFLALDREKLDQKYEFRNGQMIAMAGGTANHGILIGNTYALIHSHLRKSPCFAFVEGTLKIEDDCFLPDIMVTCNEQDLTENKTYIEHPKLVIEVLSPSTERDDRRDKFLNYTNCLSIQEYVLINWDCMLIQRLSRRGIEWLDSFYTGGEVAEFASIGLTVPVEEIYDRVVLPPFDSFRGYKRKRKS